METKIAGTDRPVSIDYAYQTDLSWYSKDSLSLCSLSLTKAWKRINTTIGSISLKERPEKTDSGMRYTTELSAIHPGHETETPAAVADISGRKVMLKITFRSGKEKIIGNSVNAPRLIISPQSATSTVQLIESTWASDSPNLWLAASIDSEGEGGI